MIMTGVQLQHLKHYCPCVDHNQVVSAEAVCSCDSVCMTQMRILSVWCHARFADCCVTFLQFQIGMMTNHMTTAVCSLSKSGNMD